MLLLFLPLVGILLATSSASSWTTHHIGSPQDVQYSTEFAILRTVDDVAAISLKNGDLVWRKRCSASSVTVLDDRHIVQASAEQVSTLKVSTGQLLWQRPLARPSLSTVCHDKTRVIVVDKSQVMMLAASSGSRIWASQFKEELPYDLSACAVSCSSEVTMVCVAPGSPDIYWQEFDRSGNSSELITKKSSIELSQQLALVSGALVAVANDGKSICVFKKLWNTGACFPIDSMPSKTRSEALRVRACGSGALVEVNGPSSQKYYHIQVDGVTMTAIQHGSSARASCSWDSDLLYIAHQDTPGSTLMITAYDANTGDVVGVSSEVASYPPQPTKGQPTQPIAMWSHVVAHPSGTKSTRHLVLSSDETLSGVEGGALRWFRDDALSNIKSVVLIDSSPAAEDVTLSLLDTPSIAASISSNLLKAWHVTVADFQKLLASLAPAKHAPQAAEVPSDVDLNNILIAATEASCIVAMRAHDATRLWTTCLDPLADVAGLSELCHNGKRQVFVMLQYASSTTVQVLDPASGAVLAATEIPERITHVHGVPSPHNCMSHFHLVSFPDPLSSTPAVHVYPPSYTPSSPAVFWQQAEGSRTLAGYRFFTRSQQPVNKVVQQIAVPALSLSTSSDLQALWRTLIPDTKWNHAKTGKSSLLTSTLGFKQFRDDSLSQAGVVAVHPTESRLGVTPPCLMLASSNNQVFCFDSSLLKETLPPSNSPAPPFNRLMRTRDKALAPKAPPPPAPVHVDTTSTAIRGLSSFPAHFESSIHTVIWGRDLSYSLVRPGSAFDVLGADFAYSSQLLSLVVTFAVAALARGMLSLKNLHAVWV